MRVENNLDDFVERLQSAVDNIEPLKLKGRVIQVVGTIVKVIAPQTKIGDLCLLSNPEGTSVIQAEVIGFERDVTLLTPMGDMTGVSSATEVEVLGEAHKIAIGEHLLGQVLDGMGNQLDQDSHVVEPENIKRYPVYADPPSPLKRQLIDTPLNTGVKAIDGFMTCGEGVRLGLFAAAGVGKSVLLGMFARNADVDVTVIALIGERGREVREFIDVVLGPDGLAKTVVVVATSDRPAIERIKAAYVATAIAEYFRDQGKKVLLLMDSLTRFARAQREIGLATGEPPTRCGYPPSVFALMPKLVERAGKVGGGSITAFYTVLVEGDDMTEPVADECRSLLDGHIVLSRDLAAANHYPAIDVLDSLSRVMPTIVSEEHRAAAAHLRDLMAKYQDIELLVRVGEYKKGEDAVADEALKKIEKIRLMLRQNMDECVDIDQTLAQLRLLVES